MIFPFFFKEQNIFLRFLVTPSEILSSAKSSILDHFVKMFDQETLKLYQIQKKYDYRSCFPVGVFVTSHSLSLNYYPV